MDCGRVIRPLSRPLWNVALSTCIVKPLNDCGLSRRERAIDDRQIVLFGGFRCDSGGADAKKMRVLRGCLSLRLPVAALACRCACLSLLSTSASQESAEPIGADRAYRAGRPLLPIRRHIRSFAAVHDADASLNVIATLMTRDEGVSELFTPHLLKPVRIVLTPTPHTP